MAHTDSTGNDARDSNPDPITGAPGSHPIGTGIGAAGGGIAAGAAVGSFAGPVGTVIGAVVGALAGGLAGKGVAEMIDPTAEDAHWQENYKTRPYYDPGVGYDEVAPAYKYGWESKTRHEGKSFEEAEPHLRQDWDRQRGQSNLSWDRAKEPVRDAWSRVGGAFSQDAGAMTAAAAGGTTQELREGGEARVPVVEEELKVGKREVETGGVRVNTTTQETPVEEKINLREEHVRVDRRPVDRPATAADVQQSMRQGSMEVTARAEEAVVQKEARVVEEVVLNKEATERTETVRDSVRRTDVDVERINDQNRSSTNNDRHGA
jgi:uncharacterized protein (TIGR02271 family)